MSSNERLSPKPSTRGTSRRTSVNPIPINTSQDQNIRDTQYPDEEFLLMEDDPYASNPPRPPSSAIRLNKPAPTVRRSGRDVTTETQTRRAVQPPYAPPPVPPRRTQKQDLGPLPASARPVRNTTSSYDGPTLGKQRRNLHWLLYIGLGMIAALALWTLGASALNWGTNKYNDFVYGYPRTFQIDAVVGHDNDSVKNPSHFIAVNLHGQVIIFELPAGDPSKALDYTGPNLVGTDADLIPVTLSFSDVNNDGRVDMIVHISDRDVVFYNNGTRFVPQSQFSPAAQQTPTVQATP
jgi:hypothetical protein